MLIPFREWEEWNPLRTCRGRCGRQGDRGPEHEEHYHQGCDPATSASLYSRPEWRGSQRQGASPSAASDGLGTWPNFSPCNCS